MPDGNYSDGINSGRVELDTVSFQYFQKGEGPDLLWIPAGDQTGDVFFELFSYFTDTHRCLSYNPRGAGDTVCSDSPPWRIEDLAADCAAFIEKVCKPPVIVAGLSMGALVIQELAMSYPHLIRIAIPMGTIAKKTGFAWEWEESEILYAEKGGSLPPDLAVIHYAILSYPSEVLGDDELWEKCRPYVSGAYEERDPAMLAAQWRACMEYDSTARLPDCKVPMHVISFSHDLQTPPSRGRKVAELAGNGHFHLLEGLGHYSMYGHRPGDVAGCIRKIIDSEAG